jgi:hypothetical protein
MKDGSSIVSTQSSPTLRARFERQRVLWPVGLPFIFHLTDYPQRRVFSFPLHEGVFPQNKKARESGRISIREAFLA